MIPRFPSPHQNSNHAVARLLCTLLVLNRRALRNTNLPLLRLACSVVGLNNLLLILLKPLLNVMKKEEDQEMKMDLEKGYWQNKDHHRVVVMVNFLAVTCQHSLIIQSFTW